MTSSWKVFFSDLVSVYGNEASYSNSDSQFFVEFDGRIAYLFLTWNHNIHIHEAREVKAGYFI